MKSLENIKELAQLFNVEEKEILWEIVKEINLKTQYQAFIVTPSELRTFQNKIRRNHLKLYEEYNIINLYILVIIIKPSVNIFKIVEQLPSFMPYIETDEEIARVMWAIDTGRDNLSLGRILKSKSFKKHHLAKYKFLYYNKIKEMITNEGYQINKKYSSRKSNKNSKELQNILPGYTQR